jgi:hypothetical protein
MFLYSVASATKALATAKIDVNEQCRVRPVITIRIWPRAKKKTPCGVEEQASFRPGYIFSKQCCFSLDWVALRRQSIIPT